jgi:hypothetical protein
MLLAADPFRCMTTTAGDSLLELDYPSAFAKAFLPTVKTNGKRFKYVHLSGGMVERDQTRALWVKSGIRKIKVRTAVSTTSRSTRKQWLIMIRVEEKSR